MGRLIYLSDPPDADTIHIAADLISAGNIIISPTDTLFGIIADATNPQAVDQIFMLKKRRPEQTLPLIAAGLEQVEQYALFSEAEHKLAEAFWPGPLTLLLKSRKNCSVSKKCVENETIAVRVPACPFNRQVAEASRKILTATSTNFSGEQPAAHTDEIHTAIRNRVAAIFDGGPSSERQPSTIVKITAGRIHFLREGPVSRRQIKEATGLAN